MNVRKGAPRDDQPAISGTRKGHDIAFDLIRISHVERAYLDADGWGYRLDHRERGDTAYQVSKNCDALDLRCDLVEQLQPFAAQAVFKLQEASSVAAWLRQGRRVT